MVLLIGNAKLFCMFQSVVTVDGDKLLETHTDDNLQGMDMNITRYIDGGKMIVVCT